MAYARRAPFVILIPFGASQSKSMYLLMSIVKSAWTVILVNRTLCSNSMERVNYVLVIWYGTLERGMEHVNSTHGTLQRGMECYCIYIYIYGTCEPYMERKTNLQNT